MGEAAEDFIESSEIAEAAEDFIESSEFIYEEDEDEADFEDCLDY